MNYELLAMNYRIGIDIRSLMSPIRTGVGEYTYELLNALFEIDKNNEYFLFYNSYADVSSNIPAWNQENVHYVVTKWPNKIFNGMNRCINRPKLDKLIIKKIKKNIKILQYYNIKHLDSFFSPNLNFTALSKNTKHILTIHDLSFEFFPEFYSAKRRLWHKIINAKKQCERADMILTPSENTKRDVCQYYGILENKVKVINPGRSSLCWPKGADVAKTAFNTPSSVLPLKGGGNDRVLRSNYILFLGTVELRKNIIGLIEAYELSSQNLSIFRSFDLIIAGAPGFGYEKIIARANKSPRKDRIKFLGYIPAEDKVSLYSNASLFIFPSFYEGFGFPVLEAMACGCPVITSNRSSLPEITEGAAYLVNPNNSSNIAQGITKIVGDRHHVPSNDRDACPLREILIKKGFEQASKFTWKKSARELLEILAQ